MKNVEIKVDAKTQKLTLTIDLKKEHGKSGSGKNVIIATTAGNVAIPETDGVKLGLNVYRAAE